MPELMLTAKKPQLVKQCRAGDSGSSCRLTGEHHLDELVAVVHLVDVHLGHDVGAVRLFLVLQPDHDEADEHVAVGQIGQRVDLAAQTEVVDLKATTSSVPERLEELRAPRRTLTQLRISRPIDSLTFIFQDSHSFVLFVCTNKLRRSREEKKNRTFRNVSTLNLNNLFTIFTITAYSNQCAYV